MGFLTGSVTYLRFRTPGPPPGTFGSAHLIAFDEHKIGRERVATADGVECGWAAGRHVLDEAFGLEKNVVAEALVCDFATVVDRLPADLMRAYYEIELKALSKNNPSGRPSAKQKREAKDYARERLEQEAKDGRFKKRKCVPVLWDGATGDVFFGATSLTHVDRFTSLFKQTFGVELSRVTAGTFEPHDDAVPTAFGADKVAGIAWVPDENIADYLGNEFLLWLWFLSEGETDTVKVPDGSEVTFMFARDLVVECPRGQTGADGFKHDGPTRLPEARRAIQFGKLPRRAGLVLVRHDTQYEFKLHAESLGVGGAKLPAPSEENARARLEERVGQVRHLAETIDQLYRRFLSVRTNGAAWKAEADRMRRWLGRESAA